MPFCAAALLAVAGCGDPAADLPPQEAARAALMRGDGLGAEVILRQMLADGTPQADIAAYLGEAELQQGQLVEARRWLGEGRFSDATVGHGFHMLGRLELRSGNLPAAGQAFDKAYARIPDSAELWVDIGRLRYRGGEQKQAIDASRRAVELGPENPAALLLRAQLVRDAEGLAAAVPWFEAGLKHAPDDFELLGDYAATLGDLGRAKDMLAVVRRMAEIDPRSPRVYYLQAVIAARGGEFQLARALLGKVGPGLDEMPAAMMLSGSVDIQNGNYQSAAQTLDRLVAMQPDNVRARELLVHALALGLNDRELAYRFAALGNRASGSPYLRQALGRAYEGLGQRDKAAPLLDQAGRTRSRNLAALAPQTGLTSAVLRRAQGGEAIQSLVRGKINAGSSSSAVNEAEAFRGRFPGSADALALAGDANLSARRPAVALSLYRSAADVRRTWPLVRRMATAQRALGQHNQAVSLIEDYLQGDAVNHEASAELARIAIERAEWDRATMLLDHALAHGGSHDPQLWRWRAEVAARTGDEETAYDAAVYAYALQPLSREAVALLAARLEQAGEADRARVLKGRLRRMGG